MSYWLYILRFSNGKLYIGQTNGLDRRLKDHRSKTSRTAKFSRENGEFKLVYKENYSTLVEAMRREKQLKGWTRAKKEALIKGDLGLLKKI
jgi:predicted GIY-YIG superfamily endonuclease